MLSANKVHTDLALVKVVNDGVVESFFELALRLGAMELKLRTAHVIWPLKEGGDIEQQTKTTSDLLLDVLFLMFFLIIAGTNKDKSDYGSCLDRSCEC